MAREIKNKIRIKLRGYDYRILDESVRKIVEAAKQTGAIISGPIPLPTRKEIFCVIRSPHVDKESREHFEIRTHSRLIDIIQPNEKTIEELRHMDLPAGVDIDLKA